MENSVPQAKKARFVKCPRCRNLLQEYDDVPVYRCGVCDTILQAKHSMKKHAIKSPPAQSNFGDEQNSENDAPNLTVESSTLGLNSKENLENDKNMDDETSECLGDRMADKLNLGNDESEMLSSEEKKEEEIVGEKRVVDGTKSSDDGLSPNNQGIDSSLNECGEDGIALPEFKEMPGRSSSALLPPLSSSHREMEDENSSSPSQIQEKRKYVIINQIQPNMMPRGSEANESFDLEIHKPTQNAEDNKSFNSSRWNDQDSNDHGRVELLKRVDELKYQLVGKLVQDESDLYGKSHLQLKDRRLARRRSLRRKSMMKMQESEPEISSHSSVESLRSSRQNVPNCVHCNSLPPPPHGIFCVNGLCTSCCHTYCSSSQSIMSGSGDWQYQASPPNPHYFLHSNSSSTSTEDSWLVRSEQQQNVKKNHHITARHCRPIFGGANLIICYKCHKLIQMPDDMVISRSRTNKMRCGICDEVLTFEIPKDSSREEVAGNLLSYSYYSVEDSGTSSTAKSFSREGKKTVSIKRDERKENTLHSLMGYPSARDVIFQPSSSDED